MRIPHAFLITKFHSLQYRKIIETRKRCREVRSIRVKNYLRYSTIKMPTHNEVFKLRYDLQIQKYLSDTNVQDLLRNLDKDPSLVLGYLKDEKKRTILLHLMARIDPEFEARLAKDEEKLYCL